MYILLVLTVHSSEVYLGPCYFPTLPERKYGKKIPVSCNLQNKKHLLVYLTKPHKDRSLPE